MTAMRLHAVACWTEDGESARPIAERLGVTSRTVVLPEGLPWQGTHCLIRRWRMGGDV
jgi:hypothetical protein